MHPAGNSHIMFRYILKINGGIAPATVHTRFRHWLQIVFVRGVLAGRLANIIILIRLRSFRHILGMLFLGLFNRFFRLIILFPLFGRHILIKIRRLYHVLQFSHRVFYIPRRVRSVVDHPALLRRFVQHIVKPAHRLIDGVHHAVRPLRCPVCQRISIVKRPVRKIPDHRQSVREHI